MKIIKEKGLLKILIERKRDVIKVITKNNDFVILEYRDNTLLITKINKSDKMNIKIVDKK